MLAMEQVAKMLADASLGTLGTTIFVHGMPPTIKTGLVVLSALSGNDIDYAGLPDLRREGFQVIARDTGAPAAMALAVQASNALTLPASWRQLPAFDSIPAAWVLYIRPRHSPFVFPRSDVGDVYEASVNFDFATTA